MGQSFRASLLLLPGLSQVEREPCWESEVFQRGLSEGKKRYIVNRRNASCFASWRGFQPYRQNNGELRAKSSPTTDLGCFHSIAAKLTAHSEDPPVLSRVGSHYLSDMVCQASGLSHLMVLYSLLNTITENQSAHTTDIFPPDSWLFCRPSTKKP